MSSLLHKLGSNEAILLMYLADELPREDRADVEQMLSSDAHLRAELDRLREVHEMLAGATSADGGMSRASNEMAVRRVLREMKRHQTELALRPAPAPAHTAPAWPVWTFPLVVGLWGFGVIDFEPIPGGTMVRLPTDPDGSDDLTDPDDDPVQYSGEQFVILDDVGHFLDEAAIHVGYLQELDDYTSDDALLLMKDPV
jgi:hypothetical protein